MQARGGRDHDSTQDSSAALQGGLHLEGRKREEGEKRAGGQCAGLAGLLALELGEESCGKHRKAPGLMLEEIRWAWGSLLGSVGFGFGPSLGKVPAHS